MKLTQKEVGAIIGVNEGTIWNWESNRTRPLPSLMPKIEEFLGYSY